MTDQERTEALEDRERLIQALEEIDVVLMSDVKELTIGDENLDVEMAVKTYLMLREQRENTKDRWERRDHVLRGMQDLIEAALGVHMQVHTMQGLNTKFGSVFTASQSTARIADRDAFLSFLKEKDLWELASVSANKATVTDYLEEHETLPPGVDYSTRVKVMIRRK